MMAFFLRREAISSSNASISALLERALCKTTQGGGLITELKSVSSPPCLVWPEEDHTPPATQSVLLKVDVQWRETHGGPGGEGHCNREAPLSLKHSQWREMRKSLSKRINPTQLSLQV